MKYGIFIPNFGLFGTPQAVADLAKDAEQAGWDGFFIWDHVARPINHNIVDPWIALTAVAMSTKKIVFGPMVTPLARRRPQVVARTTASLDLLSNGRLILGVGLGSGRPQEWAYFDEETDMKIRAKMTDEGLEILNGLWSGETFNYEGDYYNVTDSQFLPKPISQPRIPIWIAGYYPYKKPLQRAAKWDGMFILFDEVDDKIAALRETVTNLQAYRTSDAPFDIAYLDTSTYKTPKNKVQNEAHQAQEAGTTWWLVNVDPRRYSIEWTEKWDLELFRQTVLQGPPR